LKGRLRLIALVLALVALAVGSRWLPVGQWSSRFIEWVRGAGAAGIAVFVVTYIVSTVLLLPASILTLGAGLVWGPVGGLLLVSPTSVAAATAAFVVGRWFARGLVAKRVAGNRTFLAVDRAMGREGFKLVALLRLSPVFPFNVLNYALALTAVPPRQYVLASFVGMLPGTFLYTYLGSLLTSATELASGKRPSAGAAGTALYVGGFAATVLVTVLMTRFARRELNKSLEPQSVRGAP
jgi:uncharacterized membrane protein YdjX (TVP38/TMEM64 family)